MPKRRRQISELKPHKKLQQVSGREKRILTKYGFRHVKEGSRDVWIHKPTFLTKLQLMADQYIKTQQTKAYEHVLLVFRVLQGIATQEDAEALENSDNFIQFLTAHSMLEVLNLNRFCNTNYTKNPFSRTTIVLTSADKNDELQLKAVCGTYNGIIAWDKKRINGTFDNTQKQRSFRNVRAFSLKMEDSHCVTMLWTTISGFTSLSQARQFAKQVSHKALILLNDSHTMAQKVFKPIGLYQDLHFLLRRRKVWKLMRLEVPARSPLGKRLKTFNQAEYAQEKYSRRRYITNASLIFQHIEPYGNDKLYFNRVRFIIQIGALQFPVLAYINIDIPTFYNTKWWKGVTWRQPISFKFGNGIYYVRFNSNITELLYEYHQAKNELVQLVELSLFPFVVAREIMAFGCKPNITEEFFKMSSFHQGQLH